MCIFSGAVGHVSGTKIFARPKQGWQALVYEMTFSSDADVAMILPLPTPAGSGEDALRFVSLEDYPYFFFDMEQGFPKPVSRSARGDDDDALLSFGGPDLPVHAVGAFEASFVPSRRDFARLDPRFRLDERVWARLPQYADWGFAVFKLAPGREKHVHPMAFVFRQRDPERVHFPTVHVHDGQVAAEAEFDHTLYVQPEREKKPEIAGWERSTYASCVFMNSEKTQDLVDSYSWCFKREMRGRFANRDVQVARA